MDTLETQIILKASSAQVWEFFSTPYNLTRITPPELGLKIIGATDNVVYPGAIIQYVIKPVPYIPVRWVTEITHVSEGEFFVDEQRFGPYAFWHHQHRFSETPEGVLMHDIVHYELPLRFISEPMRQYFVAPQLKKIFSYRTAAIARIFDTMQVIEA